MNYYLPILKKIDFYFGSDRYEEQFRKWVYKKFNIALFPEYPMLPAKRPEIILKNANNNPPAQLNTSPLEQFLSDIMQGQKNDIAMKEFYAQLNLDQKPLTEERNRIIYLGNITELRATGKNKEQWDKAFLEYMQKEPSLKNVPQNEWYTKNFLEELGLLFYNEHYKKMFTDWVFQQIKVSLHNGNVPLIINSVGSYVWHFGSRIFTIIFPYKIKID